MPVGSDSAVCTPVCSGSCICCQIQLHIMMLIHFRLIVNPFKVLIWIYHFRICSSQGFIMDLPLPETAGRNASRFYVGAQSGSGKHLLILSCILLSTYAYVHSDTAWFHLKPVVISVILSKVIWKKHRSDEEKRNCLSLIQDNN